MEKPIIPIIYDQIPSNQSLKNKVLAQMKARNDNYLANRPSLSQYVQDAEEKQRTNNAKQFALLESQKLLNKAASSKVAANATKNIVEPGIDAAMLIEGGGLAKNAIKSGLKSMSKRAIAEEAASTITSKGTTRYFGRYGKELPYTTSIRSAEEVKSFNQGLKNQFRTGATEMPIKELNPYLTNENILKPESTGRDIAGNYLHNTHKYTTQDLSKLLQESKDYIKNNPNDKFIPEIQRRISELEKGVQKDIKLQEIAKKNNREFFDTGKWISPSYVNVPAKDQLGTVTTSSNLWDMVFKSEGKMKPYTNSETLYFNTGGEGQLARSRMAHPDKQGGAVNLIFDKNSLAKENIFPDKSAGEVTITKEVPLRHLYPEAKLKAKDILLNEAEYRGIKLSNKDIMQINKSLGINEK
jgi:hypothetical protein